MTKSWKVGVPRRSPVVRARARKKKLVAGLKTAAVALAIGAAYFGIIAMLMTPAFDIA